MVNKILILGIKMKIYTDGSTLKNPGKGGIGVLIIGSKGEIEISKGYELTTNNRMEMMAVIEALAMFSDEINAKIYTDSQYVKNGITEWIDGWKKNNWKTFRGEDVKNKDLWLEMDKIVSKHKIEWFWVKGHSGIEGNERADKLARAGAESEQNIKDNGYVDSFKNKKESELSL